MKKFSLTGFWIGKIVMDQVIAKSKKEARKLFFLKYNIGDGLIEVLVS